jgi:hypothetical protein
MAETLTPMLPAPEPASVDAIWGTCPHYAGQPGSMVVTNGASCWWCGDCRKWVVVPDRSPKDEARRRREQDRINEAAAVPVAPHVASAASLQAAVPPLAERPTSAASGFRERFVEALDVELPDSAVAAIARAVVNQALFGDHQALELILRLKGEYSR